MDPAISVESELRPTQCATGEARRLRILYLPSWYPHPTHPTYAIFLQVQAEALARHHDLLVVPPPLGVSLFSSPRNWFDRCEIRKRPDNLSELHLTGPNYTPAFPGSNERIIWRLYRRSFGEAVRFFGAPPDLIHAHSVEAGYFATGLAQQHNCPVVLTEHINRPALLLKTARSRKRFRHTMHAARCVMALSPMQRDLLYEAGVQRPIEIVPEMIDTDFFHLGPPTSSPPPFRLITTGNLLHRKGFHRLLEAVAQLRRTQTIDLRLDLIGKGDMQNHLQHQAASLGVSDVVRFHGERSQREVRDLLQQSHIYVSPSLTESFGVAVIEAMSVGLPVVTTRSGGPESFVFQPHGDVVEPDSSQELVRGILDVVHRLHDFDRHALHEYIVERFSQEVVVRNIERCYRLALTEYATVATPPWPGLH